MDTIAVEAAQSTAAVIRTGSVALSTLLAGTVSVVAGLAFWLGPRLYLRFSGREPRANVSRALTPSIFDAAAAASRPGPSSGFPPMLLEVGVRLANLSESERREGLQSVELVLDVAESERQPVKLCGLNPAGRALVHQLCSSRGLNHETSKDKEYMSVCDPVGCHQPSRLPILLPRSSA